MARSQNFIPPSAFQYSIPRDFFLHLTWVLKVYILKICISYDFSVNGRPVSEASSLCAPQAKIFRAFTANQTSRCNLASWLCAPQAIKCFEFRQQIEPLDAILQAHYQLCAPQAKNFRVSTANLTSRCYWASSLCAPQAKIFRVSTANWNEPLDAIWQAHYVRRMRKFFEFRQQI